jgi:hypothetical protein
LSRRTARGPSRSVFHCSFSMFADVFQVPAATRLAIVAGVTVNWRKKGDTTNTTCVEMRCKSRTQKRWMRRF